MVISFIGRFACAGARWLGLGWLTAHAALAMESLERSFQLPAGEAEQTLRQFVEQADQQVLYWVYRVRGIKTNAVSGQMTAAEALGKMLADTGLNLTRNDITGALAINARSLTPRALSGVSAIGEVIKLSPYEVAGATYSGYVASGTFAGGKTVMRLQDVPQTVNVVTRDLIDDLGAIDPTEVLSKVVPGVSGFAGPSGVNAMIRGFRAQNWSVDGATTRYLSMLTNFNYEAFEVIKGPASVTFGPFAAYGGYVNMIPKKPHRHHVNRVEVAVGTDELYSGMIDLGGMIGREGNLQYRLVAGLVDAGRPGWNWDFNRVQLIAPSLAYDFSASSRLTLRFEFLHSDQKLSTTALDAVGRLVPEFSSYGPPLPDANRYNTGHDQLVQAVFTSRLNDEWSTRLNLMAGLGKKRYDQLNLVGQGPSTDYRLNAFQGDYRWNTFFVDYSLSWQVDDVAGSGMSNHLVGSLSMDHWENTYTIFDGLLIAPVNTWRINPNAPDWPAVVYRFDYPTRYIPYNTEWLGGIVLEDRVGFMADRLQLSAAVRWNYDNRSSHTIWRTPQTQAPGGIYLGNPQPALVNKKLTFRYGVVYKPTERLAFYAGHTEAYLAVGAIYKSDGSRLQPETGRNREAGLKLDFLRALGGTFSGSLAAFEIKVRNKWRSDPMNHGYFIQDRVQINRGIEAQLTYMSEQFSGLIGVYLANAPKEQGTGLRAVFSPDQTFNLWVKYNVTKRLSFGGGYRYMGKTISSNRLRTSEPFGMGDLFASYEYPLRLGRMTYRLGVTNVSDDPAVYRIDSAASIHREDGRRIKFTVGYDW